jgi:hypothetical protein
MTSTTWQVAIAVLVAGIGLSANGARATGQEAAEALKILDKYNALRPPAKELAIFQLDWAPGLKEAKDKAATEKRPIFLIVVTNSYGNMYTGHC